MAGTDNEILVRLTAETAQLKAGMQSAADSVTEANAQMAASSEAAAGAIQSSAMKAAETEAAAAARIHAMVAASIEARSAEARSLTVVTDATRQNTFTTADWTTQMKAAAAVQADESEASITAAMAVDSDTAALETNTGATVENAAAQSTLNTTMMSGNATREYGALVDEALRGRYSQMIGTTAVLGNRMHLLKFLFSGTGLAIAGVVATVGAFIASAIVAEDRLSKLTDANLATSDASGVTADAMATEAANIGDVVGTIGKATDAMYSLAMSGKFMGDSLRTATSDTVDLMQLTGEKSAAAAKQIESLGTDPTKAVIKLNDQFHFLTEAQFEEIQSLQSVGDTATATQFALDDMKSTIHDAALQSQDDANIFVKAWRGVKNTFDEVGTSVNAALGGGTLDAKIAEIKSALAAAQMSGDQTGTGSVSALQAQLAALEATKRAAEETAKLKSEQDQVASAGIAAAVSLTKFENSLKTTSRATQELTAKTKELWAIYRANPTSTLISGMHFNTGNMTISGAAYDHLKTEIEKKFADSPPKATVLMKTSIDPAIWDNTQVAAQPKITIPVKFDFSKIQHLKLTDPMKATAKAIANDVHDINNMFGTISTAFDQTVTGVIRGTETWQQGMRKMWQSILQESIAMMVKELVQFMEYKTVELIFGKNIADQETAYGQRSAAAKVAATAASSDQTNKILSSATAIGMQTQAKSATASIGTSGAVAAAGSAASVSTIPVVGWAMAAEVAAVILAVVLGFKSMVSAAGGWENIPADQLAMVHKSEMILPAPIAQAARDTFSQGGRRRGGDTHININAMDARSMHDSLRRNHASIAAALHHSYKMGALT